MSNQNYPGDDVISLGGHGTTAEESIRPWPPVDPTLIAGSVVHVLDATAKPRKAHAHFRSYPEGCEDPPVEFCGYRKNDIYAVPPEIDEYFWYARLAQMCNSGKGWHVSHTNYQYGGNTTLTAHSWVHSEAAAREANPNLIDTLERPTVHLSLDGRADMPTTSPEWNWP